MAVPREQRTPNARDGQHGATHRLAVLECSAGTTTGVPAAGADAAGNGVRGIPGVPSSPASQGSDAANTRSANGQSCLPGCGTTAQSIPLERPSAQSE